MPNDFPFFNPYDEYDDDEYEEEEDLFDYDLEDLGEYGEDLAKYGAIYNAIRKDDFPVLGIGVAYLDNAATTQLSYNTIADLREYLFRSNANPGKGLYELSVRAEKDRQDAREHIAEFFGADPEQIAFTSGATASLNMLAFGLRGRVKKGDEILVSIYEHHSNFLPWQRLAKETGATLKILYDFSDSTLEQQITEKTQIVAVTGQSNVTGVQPPLKKIAKLAHKNGAVVVADLAQYIAHALTNLKLLDVDYAAFSAHKFYGPMGVGILYAKDPDSLEPLMLGGGMVDMASETDFTPVSGIAKLEAGTCNLPGIVAFSESLWELDENALAKLMNDDVELTKFAKDILAEIPEVELCGAEHGVISFNVKGVHPHDVASILDNHGVCIRAGKMCAEPLINYLADQKSENGELKYPALNEFKACCRVSLAGYTRKDDIERLQKVIKSDIIRLFHTGK